MIKYSQYFYSTPEKGEPMDWKIDGVSIEPEEMFEDLKHRNLPLGVIVFGADSALKADVYRMFRKHLGQPLAIDRKGINGYTGQIRASFHKGQPILVCLHGDKSLASDCQSVTRRLQKLGAHTLVGIYAKAYRSDAINFSAIDAEADFDLQAYYRQINSLLNNPPSPEPFHCFITVESSDGSDYPSATITDAAED